MKTSSYDEQQAYISSQSWNTPIVPSTHVDDIPARDLMNPSADENLEAEGELQYSEAQVDSSKYNSHPWHGWGKIPAGRAGYGGAVRNVLLSGSYAQLRALDIDSKVSSETLETSWNATIGHNLLVNNNVGVKGGVVISDNVTDEMIDTASYGIFVDSTKEDNYIAHLTVDEFSADTASFDYLTVKKKTTLSGSLLVRGTSSFNGPVKITGSIGASGVATFATTSVFKKDVYVGGNLFVEGSASYINTEQLYIEDKSITVASGAASPEAADGAGFDIDGAGVEFHYNAQNNQMTLNVGLSVDGDISASNAITAPTGNFISSSIQDLTSNHAYITNLTASYISASTISGSFVGDGSGLTGVTMSVSNAPKCKHVINLRAGESFEVTHPFETQNVLVQVYKWEDSTYQPQDNEDEILDWEEPAIQVQDAVITVFKDEDESVQDHYKVRVTYPEDLHGYIVIADAGLYVSGSGYIDIVEATREVKWFGTAPIPGIIPEGASEYPEIHKGDSYTFDHTLGTKNILVQVYRYYPRVDEHTQEIFGWFPIKYEPEYVAINDINQIEVMFSKAPENVGDDTLLTDYFGYIVLGKAGCLLKEFSIGSASLEEAEVHYGTSGSWTAHNFSAATMSTHVGIVDEMTAEYLRVAEYIDTPKIGNLTTGPQYYDESYYGQGQHVWDSYIEFGGTSIDSYLYDPENRTNFTASSLRGNGDLYLAGGLYTDYPNYTLSDGREKRNIQTLTGSLDNLKKIRGVSFEWKNGNKSIGTIAQEVQSIYPELTKVRKTLRGDQRISVNYEGLVGVLVEAVKTLSSQVEQLTYRIEQLEKDENR